MADITIPDPDANGYWHFTYITTDPIDGRWYGGKRSTKKHPLSDRYLGSGNWIKNHPARDRLKREIVAFYAGSAEVFSGEAEMITWSIVISDHLCMNETRGGDGYAVESIKRLHSDSVFRASYEAGIARRSADPLWRDRHYAMLQRIHADPIIQKRTADAVRQVVATPDYRSNHSAAMARRSDNPEWQVAHAKKLHRMHTDPEIAAKRNASNKAVALCPEYKAKQRTAALELRKDPVYSAKLADGYIKRSSNPEWLENTRAALRLRNAALRLDPEWRAKQSAIATRREAKKRAARALLVSDDRPSRIQAN